MTQSSAIGASVRLESERLVLEPLRPEHAGELATVLDDTSLHQFIGGPPGERGSAASALWST